MANDANGDGRLVSFGSLSLDLADIYALHSYRENSSVNLLDPGPEGPAVKVFTRLRESGNRERLLTFVLHDSSALDAWELLGRMTRRDAANRLMFERYGQWYLRPDRIRVVDRRTEKSYHGTETHRYQVFVSPLERERDGGWVTQLDLDEESGRALDAWIHRASSTGQ